MISVIIPTYNRAQKVTRAIESALAQKDVLVEVLVIDDGSTDGTQAIIEAGFRSDPRVRYFKKVNGGVAAARNKGLQEARGEYLAFLDADDTWRPGKLRLQLEVLKCFPDAGLVWTDMAAVDTEGKLLHERYLRRMYNAYDFFPTPQDLFSVGFAEASLDGISAFRGEIFSPMVLGNLIHTSCLMLRRTRLEQVGFINEALGNCGEDYDFHLRICKAGPVAYLDATFVDYEIGSPDALTSSEKMINYALHYLKTLEETVSQDGHRIKLPDGLLRKRWAAGLAWAGHEHLRVGRNMRAAGYFARSFLKEPSKPIRLLFFAATFMPAHSLIKLKAVKKRWTDT